MPSLGEGLVLGLLCEMPWFLFPNTTSNTPLDFFPFCVALSSFIFTWKTQNWSVADLRGPGGLPPLILDQNESWRAKKSCFFLDCPPLPYLKVWICHCWWREWVKLLASGLLEMDIKKTLYILYHLWYQCLNKHGQDILCCYWAEDFLL